jgi:hypothetical protein
MDAQPRVELPVPANGARVVVAKFNDYQCPACRQATWPTRDPAKYESAYPGQGRLSLDYPLEAECNTGGIHSRRVKRPSPCAARAKNDPAMEEWCSRTREADARPREGGMTEVAEVTDFDARYANPRRGPRRRSSQAQITGAPTFFINGIRIDRRSGRRG